MEQNRNTAQLAEKLRSEYVLLNSWPKVSVICSVLTPEGLPNPKLAQSIANGYEPKKMSTRIRLGLPPICPVCYQHLPKPPRQVKFDPVQMEAVIAFLRSHEKPTIRVYTRGGIHHDPKYRSNRR
jgi:hypothetical protein